MKTLLSFLIVSSCAIPLRSADSWVDFRGPTTQGHVDVDGLPLEWSESKHVAWKSAIPGRGWSTPIIWGEQIWVTTAVGGEGEAQSLRALCIHRASGAVLHDVEVFKVGKPDSIHSLNSYASPSPTIEAGRVYIHFGTYGTACLATTNAEEFWRRDDLKLSHQVGPGSSPVLVGNLLIVNMDGTDLRYVVALDKRTGDTVWRTDRSNDVSARPTDTHKAFSTPIVVQVDGKPQLISSGAHAVMGYEPTTGREIWRVQYDGFSNVSRPVTADGFVFINTGYMKPQLLAIRLGGRGDVTESHVEWTAKRGIPAKPSPILLDGVIYLVEDKGIAVALDAATGKQVWMERLGGQFSASLLYAGGHLYFCDQEGKTTVVKPGRTFDVRAVNQLDSGLMASPAVAGKALFLRTETHLYRIEKRTVASD